MSPPQAPASATVDIVESITVNRKKRAFRMCPPPLKRRTAVRRHLIWVNPFLQCGGERRGNIRRKRSAADRKSKLRFTRPVMYDLVDSLCATGPGRLSLYFLAA